MPSVHFKTGVDVRRKRAHYYWDWHGVRFVQINLSVVDGMFTKTDNYKTFGYNSYSYLEEVLNDSKNMPIVICTHIGLGGGSPQFVANEDAEKFKDIVKKNKNIIAILHGHTHGCRVYSYDLEDNDSVMCYDAGRVIDHKEAENRGNMAYGEFFEFVFDDENKQIKCNIINVQYNKTIKIDEKEEKEVYSHTITGITKSTAIKISTDRTQKVKE